MAQPYEKPHRTFTEQLQLLESRGLACADRGQALAVLRAAGYYRLSAYVYPFRELLSDDETPTSPYHFRSDRIREGTRFEHVEKLWRFDRHLRLAWFDALETIEVGVRTQVAYVLGMRNKFGHVDRGALNETACRELVTVKGERHPAFAVWQGKYDDLRRKAMAEDYMKHNLHKYDGQVPVWIAVEFFDFGAVARLFKLMKIDDQNTISRDLDIKNGKQLVSVLGQLNYVRNLCAHHSRLWNRTLTLKVGRYPAPAMPAMLAHVADVQQRDKVYVALAYTAHLAHELDPASNWPSRLRTVLRKFPTIPDVSPETHMGFRGGWADLPLWQSRERPERPMGGRRRAPR